MSTTYLVEIDMQMKGDLSAKVGAATSHTDKLDSSLKRAGSSMMDLGAGAAGAFTGAIERVGTLVAHVGMLGAAAGVGIITAGVVKFNNELEKTQISLGAIFNANDQSDSFGEGMELAGSAMKKMRQDAKELPGEFADLANILKDISVPGFQGGADIAGLEKMAAKTMATAAVMGIPMEQAGREMAMLMEGRAGAHNVLGMRLAGLGGDKAKAFNKQSDEKKLETLNTALDKYAPSIDAFKHSYEGLSSSFVDNAKHFVSTATLPLFEKVKGTLEKVNAWFDENESRVDLWAKIIGTKLGEAWDIGVEKVKQWYPAVEQFAINAYGTLSGIWEKIGPSVERFGAALQDALRDPGTIDKLIRLAEVYAAIKIGGVALDFMGGASGAGALAGGAGGLMRAGAGAAGGALAESYTGAAMGAASMGATPGVAMLLGGAATAGAALAALGGVALAADQGMKLYDEVTRDMGASAKAQYTMGMGAAEGIGTLKDASFEAYRMLHILQNEGEGTAAAALEAKIGLMETADAARHAANMMDTIGESVSKDVMAKLAVNDLHPFLDLSGGAGQADTPGKGRHAHKTGGGHGGGGTHIAKVEITVAGNADPSRVAVAVLGKLQDLQRHPRSSRDVTNYSAANR